jgi:hypothetical protein
MDSISARFDLLILFCEYQANRTIRAAAVPCYLWLSRARAYHSYRLVRSLPTYMQTNQLADRKVSFTDYSTHMIPHNYDGQHLPHTTSSAQLNCWDCLVQGRFFELLWCGGVSLGLPSS